MNFTIFLLSRTTKSISTQSLKWYMLIYFRIKAPKMLSLAILKKFAIVL